MCDAMELPFKTILLMNQVAENEAKLGSIAEVIECVRTADVLKPAKAAAEELLTIMTGDSQRIKCVQ